MVMKAIHDLVMKLNFADEWDERNKYAIAFC